MGHSLPRFPHRLLNGVYESICPGCFRTISSKQDEADLVYDETNHLCDPADLSRYQLLRMPPAGEKPEPQPAASRA